MLITRLSLTGFRNHVDTAVAWSPRLNIITGPNGAGKTNLIDAIHYLCMSRSFVAATDQYVVTTGEKMFSVEGTFEGAIRSKAFTVRCSYSRGDGKKIFVNDSPLDRLSDLIGRVPVVVLSPDDKKLTSEGPAERRSFLDAFIAQLSSAYLRDLMDYRRVLKQRNALLGEYRMSRDTMKSMIEPWDMQLVAAGSRIVHTRAVTLDRYASYLEQGYETIAGIGHKPAFEYKSNVDGYSNIRINKSNESSDLLTRIQETYARLLEESFDKDRERQQTSVGPHRDDIVFYLNELELRKFGSQGQHRLFALALKLAQRSYYADELGDLPIFLLDDVFGDLDPGKTSVLLEMLLAQTGQVFITAANRNLFTDFFTPSKEQDAFFSVEAGAVSIS
ncbi:MAG: DNA replication/repair protein RecF [Bacteroidetes bacterium]|nr:DNA replication/repair protein RecF [Bacteroidota bacterium]